MNQKDLVKTIIMFMMITNWKKTPLVSIVYTKVIQCFEG